jgi:hypothetical protein
MMTNMTRNIQSASLKDLVEDGILKLEGQALVKYNTNPDAEMFTWTLPQAIDKMFVYMALVEKYQQQNPGFFN